MNDENTIDIAVTAESVREVIVEDGRAIIAAAWDDCFVLSMTVDEHVVDMIEASGATEREANQAALLAALVEFIDLHVDDETIEFNMVEPFFDAMAEYRS